MSLNQRISLDREAVIAIGLLWVVAFGVALAFGKDIIPAIFLSLLGTFFLSLGYIVAGEEVRSWVDGPAKAVRFFAFGMLFALLSFGGDCAIGSLHAAPNTPVLTACVENSGVGIAFTALCVAMAVGTPLVGLTRSAIVQTLGRNDAHPQRGSAPDLARSCVGQ